jgi:hypothetical protein
MLIRYDPDEHEPVYESHTCFFHQKHPGQSFAGCTCSSSISSRCRSPEEVAKIKADRLRKEEDEILARAEIIKAKRASTDTMLGE